MPSNKGLPCGSTDVEIQTAWKKMKKRQQLKPKRADTNGDARITNTCARVRLRLLKKYPNDAAEIELAWLMNEHVHMAHWSTQENGTFRKALRLRHGSE